MLNSQCQQHLLGEHLASSHDMYAGHRRQANRTAVRRPHSVTALWTSGISLQREATAVYYPPWGSGNAVPWKQRPLLSPPPPPPPHPRPRKGQNGLSNWI